MENKKSDEVADDINNASTETDDWIRAQNSLKTKLVLRDDFEWLLPGSELVSEAAVLRYVAGVDVSYAKEDPTAACGGLVVLDLSTLEVVYEDFNLVHLDVPYVPGFLAFREVPVILELLERMKRRGHPCFPQLLMVDGNGVLHPRGFGLASHLGVLADLPSIGIGKNLHCVEGLTEAGVRQLLAESREEFIFLNGQSGCKLGAAMLSAQGSMKPIYISTGHRISLASAILVVEYSCKFRVPEPIRQGIKWFRDPPHGPHSSWAVTVQQDPIKHVYKYPAASNPGLLVYMRSGGWCCSYMRFLSICTHFCARKKAPRPLKNLGSLAWELPLVKMSNQETFLIAKSSLAAFVPWSSTSCYPNVFLAVLRKIVEET